MEYEETPTVVLGEPVPLGLDDTDFEFDPDWAPVPLGGP
jgi:hypothetical protein